MSGVVVIVPARAASSRFPNKPLASLLGATGIPKPLVRRSWEAARAVPGVDRVIVATDDRAIAGVVEGFGGEALMTPATCRNGTERCAAALALLDARPSLVVNLQGDAPLTPPAMVAALIARAIGADAAATWTPALACSPATRARLLADAAAGRVGGTTVVFDREGRALYFSKHVLPFQSGEAAPIHLHVGAYAYRPDALEAYAAAQPSAPELAEGLEQLRFLDIGAIVRVVVAASDDDLWEVNNPGDIAPVEAALARRGIV